jgi:hypothetical protein
MRLVNNTHIANIKQIRFLLVSIRCEANKKKCESGAPLTKHKKGCQQQNANNIRDTNISWSRDAAKTDLRIFFSHCCQRYGESTTRRHGESATLQLTDAGSQRLSDSPIRGVNFKKFNSRFPDSPIRGAAVDSPTHRYGSRRLPDSSSRGVDFRLRMSPQIRSQNRNGSKDSVRDLCRTDSCKKIEKSLFIAMPL